MEIECKIINVDDVQELLQYAKCNFDQKNTFEAEFALIQARIQNPWNNAIQHNLSLVTQEKSFDIPPTQLWALRFPFEFWIFMFFISIWLTRKYLDFKNYFISFGICCLLAAAWNFTQEHKFQQWTLINESSPVYNLPNLNYEQDRLKRGSLVYLKSIQPGFSKIIYKDKIAFIPSEKLLENKMSVSDDTLLGSYFHRILAKLRIFSS